MTSLHHLLNSRRYFYQMNQKGLIIIMLFCCCLFAQSFAADIEYQQKLKQRLSIQAQEVFVRYKLVEDDIKTPHAKGFPEYDEEEINHFLKEKFGKWYDGYNSLIDEYVRFYTSQPHQHIRIWFGLYEYFLPDLTEISTEGRVVLSSLALSQSNFLTYLADKESTGIFSISAPIALYFGCKVSTYEDERRLVAKNIEITESYLKTLVKKFTSKSQSLGALVVGANTINKAKVADEFALTYWDLYPHLKSTNRDFYPAMLAAAFVWSKRKEWRMDKMEFEESWKTRQVTVDDSLHFAQISKVLKLDEKTLAAYNPQYIKQIVFPGNKIMLPKESTTVFETSKTSIYSYERNEYFPKKSDSCYVFYRTKPGDYFKDLTRWFGPGLEEIKNLNGFTSNTLKKNWDVFFKVPRVDSVFFASFDNLSRAQKDAVAKGSPIPEETIVIEEKPKPKVEKQVVTNEKETGRKITYTVKSGDTLWGIGQKHKVTDKDIMHWNNIGANIQPGQKLIIYVP